MDDEASGEDAVARSTADRRERARQYGREYRQRNAAQIKAYRDRWREENPEKHRAHSRDSARRARDRADRLLRARESRRRWEENNREKARAYRAQWRERNRDRVRAQGRASYQRNKAAVAERSKVARDQNPAKYAEDRARARRWRQAHPERVAEYARERRKDPEKYERQLQQNRDAKRLRRRLKELSLDPIPRHRSTAAQRRAHEREADRFFTSEMIREWHRQYDALRHRVLTGYDAHEDAYRRAALRASAAAERAGLPALDIEASVYARVIDDACRTREHIYLLKSRDIARLVHDVRSEHQRERHLQARATLYWRINDYVRHNIRPLRQNAVLDNRARVYAGKPPVHLDLAVHMLAFDALKPELPLADLVEKDVVWTIARLRIKNLHLFDDQTGTVPRTPAPGLER